MVKPLKPTKKTDAEIEECYLNPIEWGDEMLAGNDNDANLSDYDKKSQMSAL